MTNCNIHKSEPLDLKDISENLHIFIENVQSVPGEKIEMVVYRQFEKNSEIIENPWAFENILCEEKMVWPKITQPNSLALPTFSFQEISPFCSDYFRKEVFLKKSPEENLGIVINGGADSQWGNLPLFVQKIHPLGVLGRDKNINLGDLLISINNRTLNGLTHSQAINVIKSATLNRETVMLVVIELNYFGKREDFEFWEEMNGVYYQQIHQCSDKRNTQFFWTPSWKFWLAVRHQWCVSRDVTLKKNAWNEFGFSVANDQPLNNRVFVKYVTTQSPAVLQGHLKCGDEIIAINNRHVSLMELSEVIGQLKSRNIVRLTVISWPGSVH